MIYYQLTETDNELKEILTLQQKNLPKNLSQKEQKEQGFVTVEHNFETLKKLHITYPHTIAKHNNKIIGYALSMDVNCKEKVEILKPMFRQIERVYNHTYIVMGQVCIDKDYRGKGVFKELYNSMKKAISSKYAAIVTEIDVKNKRSIRAHQKVGFTELVRYFSDGKEWSIVILKC